LTFKNVAELLCANGYKAPRTLSEHYKKVGVGPCTNIPEDNSTIASPPLYLEHGTSQMWASAPFPSSLFWPASASTATKPRSKMQKTWLVKANPGLPRD
jgi:hypothetical protein